MTRFAALCLLTTALVGCDAHEEHAAHPHGVTLDADALSARFVDGVARFETDEPFRQLSLVLTLPDAQIPAVSWRVPGDAWRPAELTFHEGRLANLRARSPKATRVIELRTARPLGEGLVEFAASVAPERPLAPAAGPIEVKRQAMAPRDLVIPREDWGARDPGRICNDVASPHRISIHHTAGSNNPPNDPAARMRQIQSFHMNDRGWCDIGYHFVVSQDGQIFEGRRDERRPGAHVGNENSGNVGISLMGNYDVIDVPRPQFDAAARIMRWVATTYDIAFDRRVIKGHREWPGQQTACPGRHTLARFDELIGLAAGGDVVEPEPEPPPPAQVEVDFEVSWLEGAPEREGGAVLLGETRRAVVQIRNRTGGPMRGVRLAYALNDAFRATHYEIQTDHPGRDQRAWRVNDADAAPENPPKAEMGANGELTMYAFGDGETKRVLIDVEATRYSTGQDRPRLRAWVANIDGIYTQGGWNAEPGTDRVGRVLRGALRVPGLARDRWLFDGETAEGWSGCGDVDLSVAAGALGAAATGERPCLAAPMWTRLDTGAWDTLVLRTTDPGPVELAIVWQGGLLLDVRSESGTVVLPAAGLMGWQGAVGVLRLFPTDDLEIDALYLQSSADGTTNDAALPYADDAPAMIVDEREAPPIEPPPEPEPEQPPEEQTPPEVGEPMQPEDPGPGALDVVDLTGDDARRVGGDDDGGCRAAPVHHAPGATLLLLGLLVARRGRRGAR